MKRKISVICIFAILLSAFPFAATAEDYGTFSIPTITSTTCAQCGYSMDYVRDEIDTVTRRINSIDCLNSPNADPSATHRHFDRTQYAVYACSGCSAVGRKYVRYWMDCELSMANRSIDVVK